LSWLSNALGTTRPGAPTLPQAPTLQAPTLPQYPGLTPEQQALLQQQQGYLQQGQGAIANYASNPYLQQSMQANQQALQNYQNALLGKIAPNQMLEQQKARDWQQTVEQAAQQGIRLSGNSPESAVSQSTAGNQIIQDFTKRYGALEQNYNLGQQQMGQQAQQAGLGQVNQQYQNTLAGYGQLGNQAQQLYQPYQQQQLGPWQVQTQQALSNTDIANQNAMNAYQQQLQQLGLNYNSQLAGYQNSMGMLSGAAQLGGMAIGGAIGGPMGAMVGGQAGGAFGQAATGQGGGGGGFNPGSFIQAYQGMKQPQNTMGFQPYTQTPGPYAYGRAS
jgi:hypothetical protein